MTSTIALDHDGPAPGVAQQADYRILSDAALILLWLFLSYAAGSLMFGFSRDYYEYLIYYESLPRTLSLLDSRFEPGFHLVAWLSRNWLEIDLDTLIFALATVSLGIKFALFRRHLRNPVIAALLYTVLFYPIHEYTQYRVGVSLAFGFWAVHLLMERRFAWAGVLFALAFVFHYSSILLLIVTVGAMAVRGRLALVSFALVAILGVVLTSQVRYLFQDVFSILNPLSGAYFANAAMIESASITSVNNLLLIGAILCYVAASLYTRSRYDAVFLTMTIACLLPIILLPDAPIIAQRSKEVLFVGVIFLACRSYLTLRDLPGFAFVVAVTGLLGYLWVDGGIISI